jgi:predicted aspartyl protease
MGITTLPIEIGNPARIEDTIKILCTVDSGVLYSVVPRDLLQSLGIEPIARETFRLANGESIERDKGIAFFRYGDRVGGADVIFGEQGDMTLLGAFTLEALGLSLDPIRRELNPIALTL